MEDALWAQLQNSHLHDNDDNDVNRIEPETDDEEEEEKIKEPEFSLPHETMMRNSGPQTGPKGVKADHDYHKQKELDLKLKSISEYNARLLAKAPITTTYLQDQQELVLDYNNPELEDDELKYLREKRLKQLKNNNHSIRQQQKIFGHLTTITVDDYLDEIDNEWKTVPVIIHLYDESLPKCKELDIHLTELAKKYVLAKFIRVSAIDLDFDLVGSPAILAYHGGILVANLVRIIDEVGQRFDVDSIEDVLLKHNALSENDLYDLPVQDSEEEED